VKNHDFTAKKHIFSNFRGRTGEGGVLCAPPPPPGSAPDYLTSIDTKTQAFNAAFRRLLTTSL
jgi:hypothetical protein